MKKVKAGNVIKPVVINSFRLTLHSLSRVAAVVLLTLLLVEDAKL